MFQIAKVTFKLTQGNYTIW